MSDTLIDVCLSDDIFPTFKELIDATDNALIIYQSQKGYQVARYHMGEITFVRSGQGDPVITESEYNELDILRIDSIKRNPN